MVNGSTQFIILVYLCTCLPKETPWHSSTLSLNELKTYCPDRDEPADFDSFWKSTLDEARAFPLNATFEKVDYGLVAQETFDVTFNGFGGQPVKGWLILPSQRTGKLPCVVEYIGYGGGRSFAIDWLLWASAGYAHFVMDTRGQGSTWSIGRYTRSVCGGRQRAYPRQHDQRDSRPQALLLPPRLHGCRPRHRGGAQLTPRWTRHKSQ